MKRKSTSPPNRVKPAEIEDCTLLINSKVLAGLLDGHKCTEKYHSGIDRILSESLKGFGGCGQFKLQGSCKIEHQERAPQRPLCQIRPRKLLRACLYMFLDRQFSIWRSFTQIRSLAIRWKSTIPTYVAVYLYNSPRSWKHKNNLFLLFSTWDG